MATDIDLSLYPGIEFGPGAKFPGVLRFSELRDEQCAPAVNTYLNGRFDPKGKFSVGLINPGEAGWSAGERTIRCGLQFSGVTGTLLPFQGLVEQQDRRRCGRRVPVSASTRTCRPTPSTAPSPMPSRWSA